jgi:cytochrome c
MRSIPLAAAMLALATPVLAANDAAQGEKDFAKCKACHSIVDGDNAIQKGGKVGPNLFGVIGRPVGTEEGYNYGPGFKEIVEKGLVWDEEKLAHYVVDPNGWLQQETGDAGARAKMPKQTLKDPTDVAAYLAQFATPPAN